MLAAVLAACGVSHSPLPFEPAGPASAPDPAAPGPFPVGVRTVLFSDPSRPAADGSPRRLVTEIWYPAAEEARGRRGARYDVVPLLTDEQRQQIAGLTVPILATGAVREAAPRRDRAPYPLVVFSHGQGGIRWQSTFYTVTLASHGYFVAAPDHPGTTLEDALRDRLAPVLEGIEHRPQDLRFLLDTLVALPAGDPLRGLVDEGRIGATGHSFGAFTAMRAAALDSRLRAIVPQAPPDADLAFIGLAEEFPLDTPVQIQAGHADRTLPWDENVVSTWARLRPPRFLFDLVEGGHFTFTDLCSFDLAEIARLIDFADVGNALEDGCGPTAPPTAVAQPLINHFAVGFFNAVLRGSAGTWALLTQAGADARAQGVAVFTAEP